MENVARETTSLKKYSCAVRSSNLEPPRATTTTVCPNSHTTTKDRTASSCNNPHAGEKRPPVITRHICRGVDR
eukprot:scaffold19259_cov54-Attheya_sp.AAC.7